VAAAAAATTRLAPTTTRSISLWHLFTVVLYWRIFSWMSYIFFVDISNIPTTSLLKPKFISFQTQALSERAF
jgi:hypothetical protein